MVLTAGALDGEEKDQHMDEDSADSELIPGYQWLLRDLPKLPLFDSVKGTTASALQQVCDQCELFTLSVLFSLVVIKLAGFFLFSPPNIMDGESSPLDYCTLSVAVVPLLEFPNCDYN